MLLPPDYYSPTLLGLRTEQAVFAELLAWKLPRLSAHLEKHAVVAELFVTRWFVAIFANALPVETTLRVWDAFLLEGVKVLHRIGLAVLRVAEPRLLACGDQQELLCAIQEEQANCLDCERLIALAFHKKTFLRSFPRARIEALRRKHRSRLVAREESNATPPPATPPAAPSHSQPRSGGGGSGGGSGGSGGGGGALPASRERLDSRCASHSSVDEEAAAASQLREAAAAREAALGLDEDSSDAEGDEEWGDGEAAGYDMVSFDDLEKPVHRSFWL